MRKGGGRKLVGHQGDAGDEEPSAYKKGPGKPGPFVHPMAGYAGLEPATSDVTGRRSNQLS